MTRPLHKPLRPLFGAIFLLLLLLLASLLPSPAQAQTALGLSQEEIVITTNFSGTDLLLFGVSEQEGDHLLIEVRGPASPRTLFRRERIGGFWLTTGRRVFSSVPGYYAVAANAPLTEIAPTEVLKLLKIGAENLDFTEKTTRIKNREESDEQKQAQKNIWQTALIRRLRTEGLYPPPPLPIAFSEARLFQVRFPIPATARAGIYDIQVHTLRKGVVQGSASLHFRVAKGGFEARLIGMAYDQPFLYGLMGLLLSLSLGLVGYLLGGRR